MTALALALLLQIAPLRVEIVVTPERGAEERDDVAASCTVITRERLETMPAQSLAEVVGRVPGVTMYFEDAAAGAPMITARGFFGGGENEYVKLLVDGVPAGDVESGLIDWRHIRTAAIDRIEVLRGPGSSLYGDSAMGGVISVFTRDGDVGGDVRLSAGTLGSRDVDVFHRSDIGAVRLGIDALLATTDGYRDHGHSRDRGANVTLRREHVQLSASLSSKDREEPGPLLSSERATDRRASNRAFRFDRERTDRRRISLRYDGVVRAMVYASDRNTDFPRTLLLAPNFGSTLFRRVDSNSIGGSVEVMHDWSRASIHVGTDVERASLRGDYATVTSDGDRGTTVAAADIDRDQSAFFVTGDWRPTGNVRFSAGLRHDRIEKGSAWSPRLGATFRLGGTIAFLQLARAFKAPTLDQLYDPRPFPGPSGSPFTISNPSLLPQRAQNAEIGLSRTTPLLSWSVSAYRMNVKDEIDFDPTFFTYSNIGSHLHTGLEANAETRFVALRYAWTHVQLKNIPEHAAQLDVLLPHATLEYRWEHARSADDAGAFPLPDIHVVNAKLTHTIGRLRLELDALNLLNARYSYVASILNDFRGNPNVLEFPAPGRAGRVGVGWRY